MSNLRTITIQKLKKLILNKIILVEIIIKTLELIQSN